MMFVSRQRHLFRIVCVLVKWFYMFIDSARAREAKLISSSVRRPLPVRRVMNTSYSRVCIELRPWALHVAGARGALVTHQTAKHYIIYLCMRRGGDKRAETHLIIYLN